ncbi:uncharacterized protein GGS25DRAFT_520302 [Hypoxylon fragiforme]|uniref:uncharacterized protein n=1 Tax=Hypoxylon fragiforme TaxID=63214 RepID=UPI0020C7244C|nr:uncharacterized protein GGS25DRAFT_520302 [Hypoxylon fragiforme]KAI2609501.1 hypothetical protein GGS25DRAFT_520302 [Hypoxylon fragiforme]
MSYPNHEASLDRESLHSCLRLFTHPSSIPSTLAASWHETGNYYAARDVLELERAELIQIIAYTRRMAIKLTGSALFLGIVVALLFEADY